jgi:hypothetical protein
METLPEFDGLTLLFRRGDNTQLIEYAGSSTLPGSYPHCFRFVGSGDYNFEFSTEELNIILGGAGKRYIGAYSAIVSRKPKEVEF